nr:hypothetical protein [Tanacetum cinerariifolium]
MDDDMAPDEQAQSSDDEDIMNAHIPRVNLGQDWWKPLEEERPTTPDAARSILLFDVSVLTNNWASTLASNYSPPLEDLLLAQTEECMYDIATMYGISHWWFQRQRFYIDRHTSEDDRRAVRTHMRILSVVRMEVFSMYGYDYMKKIVLRRTDLNEHVITE